ncbi:hypothetical protein SVAN01_11830 [Stagonosporopsis vannaccii]|nr:hypothetical protein SVAN01_11830 [Stagonosporopsis vannaccii]
MASAMPHQQPFRFLDLPPELRCRVYDNIVFPTTWHVLDRPEALLNKREWPVPPQVQMYESRVTLIRPHTGFATEILATCHLINIEAREILIRKSERCRLQPVRYLVDYSAAYALLKASSALRSCLGMADGGISRDKNKAVRTFLRLCTRSLSRTRPVQTGSQRNSGQDVQAIEMTINYTSGIVYEQEVLETILWLGQLKYYTPTRLVVIYKSPLPNTRVTGEKQARDSNDLEDLLLQQVRREVSNQDSSHRGVFVRPLNEEAFEIHVKGLEEY